MFVFFVSAILYILFRNNIVLLFVLLVLLFLFRKRERVILFLISGLFFGMISTLIEFDYQDDNTVFVGMVYERKENYYLFSSRGRRYYVYQENHQYEVFDILYIEGVQDELSFTHLEGEFDFNEYLFNKKVFRKINVSKCEFKWKNFIRKTVIINKLLSRYSDNTRNIVEKIFFGMSNDFSNVVYDLNISHYFSLTGIIIYFLFDVFNKVLLYVLNDKKKAKFISVLMVFPFLFFNNYKLSLLKNYVLLVNRDNKKLSNDLLSNILLTILILFNYRYVYTHSFIYLFVLPFIMKVFRNGINGFRYRDRKFYRFIIFSLVICLINLFLYGNYNLLSLVLYPIFISLSRLFFVICLISFVVPFSCIDLLSNFIVDFLNFISNVRCVLYVNESNYVLLISGFLVLLSLSYFLEIRLKKLSCVCLSWYFIHLMVFCFPFDAYLSQYVVFVNVGQGDCALIHNSGVNILIDVGGSIYKDIGNDVLIPFFRKNHISKIDCVFISHNDNDHIGSLDALENNFNIGEVVIGSNFYSKTISNIEFVNLNRYFVGIDENDNSSVLYFSFIGYNFLFMGDASICVEEKIMNDYDELDVDILKVGHHGSSTSSSYDFLRYVMPKEVVISVGKNNYYNHPNEIVLKYLYSLDVVVRRTDIEGSIKYIK